MRKIYLRQRLVWLVLNNLQMKTEAVLIQSVDLYV